MVRVFLPIVFLILPALTPCWGDARETDPHAGVRLALQAELGDFSAPGWDRRTGDITAVPGPGPFIPPAGPEVEAYRARLVKVGGWTGGPVWHQMGTIPLVRAGHPDGRLGINVFFPSGISRGTLLFVHGYLSHAANFAYTYAFFVARGWTVATLDLPGHGFSTGPRGDLEGFAEYGDAVALWLTWAGRQGWPGPQVLLAHSLGTAACLEALRRPGTPVPDRVVFCAPLLRPAGYPWVTLFTGTLGWAFREVPSTFGWDNYLDGYKIPVHWVEALEQWLGDLENQVPMDLPLTVFAGDRDDVVDTWWNQQEYSRLVPGARYQLLPGRGHLFLSRTGEREAFHQQLGFVLGL